MYVFCTVPVNKIVTISYLSIFLSVLHNAGLRIYPTRIMIDGAKCNNGDNFMRLTAVPGKVEDAVNTLSCNI